MIIYYITHVHSMYIYIYYIYIHISTTPCLVMRSGDKKGMPASAAYPRLFGDRLAELHLDWMATWLWCPTRKSTMLKRTPSNA